MARKTKTTPAGAAAAAIESAAADKARAVDETPADADFAVAVGDAGTATVDDATAATDGTEVDRANPRPSGEEGDAGSGETDAPDQQADVEGPAHGAEGAERGDGGEMPAIVPEGHVAILFQRDHVIDDGLQGTLRETRFEKGARHVMSLASARHFTSRGIAVEI